MEAVKIRGVKTPDEESATNLLLKGRWREILDTSNLLNSLSVYGEAMN